MAYVLQVDFTMNGPFGDEMAAEFSGLAQSINQEEGFMWKIWTESPETNVAGGIYIFETKETAEKYLDMHSKRLVLQMSTQKSFPSIPNLLKSRTAQ
jgi:hypothetical protein